MKSIQILFFTLLTIFFISCKETKEVKASADLPVELVTTTFNIEGMHCEVGCAARAQKKLAKLDGVTDAKIDFESKLATVVYNKNAKSSEDLVETVMKLSKDYVVSNVNTTAIETKK
jgi:copper chaperone CopZ